MPEIFIVFDQYGKTQAIAYSYESALNWAYENKILNVEIKKERVQDFPQSVIEDLIDQKKIIPYQ